jgi:hypothetical protein
MDIGKLTTVDIQRLLDEHVNARFGQYAVVQYVPQGASVESVLPHATHTLILRSARSNQDVMIAIRANPPYAGLVDLLLAVF